MFEKMPDPKTYNIPGDHIIEPEINSFGIEVTYRVFDRNRIEYNPEFHIFEGIALDQHNFVHYIFFDILIQDYVRFEDEVKIISNIEKEIYPKNLLDNFEYFEPEGSNEKKIRDDKKLDELEKFLKTYKDNIINIVPYGSNEDAVDKINEYLNGIKRNLDYDIISKIKRRIRIFKSSYKENKEIIQKLNKELNNLFTSNDRKKKIKNHIASLNAYIDLIKPEIKLLERKQLLAEDLLTTILRYRNLTYSLHTSRNTEGTIEPPNISDNIEEPDTIYDWQSINIHEYKEDCDDSSFDVTPMDFISDKKKRRGIGYSNSELPQAKKLINAKIVPIDNSEREIKRVTHKKFVFESHNYSGPQTRGQVSIQPPTGYKLGEGYGYNNMYSNFQNLPDAADVFMHPVHPVHSPMKIEGSPMVTKGGKTKKNKKFCKTKKSNINKKFSKTQKSNINKKFGKTQKSKINKK
jgi:hypothetical protein